LVQLRIAPQNPKTPYRSQINHSSRPNSFMYFAITASALGPAFYFFTAKLFFFGYLGLSLASGNWSETLNCSFFFWAKAWAFASSSAYFCFT